MHSNNSTESATDTYVSGIAESRVPADQLASVPPVHCALSRNTRRIAWNKMPARRREAAYQEPYFTTGEPGVRNVPFSSDMYGPWVCYPRMSIIWYMFEHQIASKEQSLEEQLYWFDIERVLFANNH